MDMKHKLSFFLAATAVVVSVLFAVAPIAPEVGAVDGLELVPMDSGAIGPESFAFDPRGEGPYTGVSDGRIVKWAAGSTAGSISLSLLRAETCARRATGIKRWNTPGGGLATAVATQADGVSFRFTNSLDIDPLSGAVYFTDSSSQYQRRNYIPLILSGDRTGKLMKYDPESNHVTTILNNLSFPNGVALAENGDFVLVAETSTCRILRYWLKPSQKAGKVEIFAQLAGFPDNIRRSPRGATGWGSFRKGTRSSSWFYRLPGWGSSCSGYRST
ncbi:hypothetical protein NL676_017026 [Syzygium grande]|nr:hypothetical protein NL676_017026 [Syzygium grande]